MNCRRGSTLAQSNSLDLLYVQTRVAVMFAGMSYDVVAAEPVIRIPWRKGRRMFVLFGSGAFVIVSALMLWLSASSLLNDSTSGVRTWIVCIVGIIGVVFFGAIAVGAIKNYFGRKDTTALALSAAGVTDQTQIVGPLPTMPWSMIEQYNIAEYQRQLFLVLQLRDVEAYQRITELSRTMRTAFKFNTKIFGVPVHAITIKNLQGSPEDIIDALYQVTNVPPGHPLARTDQTQ